VAHLAFSYYKSIALTSYLYIPGLVISAAAGTESTALQVAIAAFYPAIILSGQSESMPVIITICTIHIQVATILLVAGPTLTLWIPGQTLFASISLYSRLL